MQPAVPDTIQLKQKAAKFCAWRERCSSEVIEKLRQLGATLQQQQQVLQWLQQENYINNKRFAATFARGKFTNNNWGRQRIFLELKSRGIDEADIQKALEEIPENEYLKTLEKLARKKWNETKTDDLYIKKQKTAAFLAGKGYENELLWKMVEKLK